MSLSIKIDNHELDTAIKRAVEEKAGQIASETIQRIAETAASKAVERLQDPKNADKLVSSMTRQMIKETLHEGSFHWSGGGKLEEMVREVIKECLTDGSLRFRG